MKLRIIFLLLIMLTSTTVSAFYHLNKDQQAFLKLMVPIIRNENKHIIAERRELNRIYEHWQLQHRLSLAEMRWLERLAAAYHLENEHLNTPNYWYHLLLRVDTVPASLVLAEAIHKSDWGTLPEVKKTNNYFLISHSDKLMQYKSPRQAVHAYVRKINSDNAYETFRRNRQQHHQKQSHVPIHSMVSLMQPQLKEPLPLHKIIKQYQLTTYDDREMA